MGTTVNFNEHMPVLEVSDGCIVSKRGDLTVGFVLYKPEIFTLGVEEYSRLHDSFVKAIKLLAPGMIVHFQDVYRDERWEPHAESCPEDQRGSAGCCGHGGFLAEASDRFFAGRHFLRHTAYCYLTYRPAGVSLANSAGSGLLRRWVVPPETLDERSFSHLRETARQFAKVLADSGLIGIQTLTTSELASSAERAGLIEQYCYLLDGRQPVLRDIDFADGLRVGDRHAILYTLADAGGLPAQCSPTRFYEKYSSEASKVFVGFPSSLGLLLPFNHIVNQYIVIGDGPATWKRLERKRLRMKSLSRYSRSNAQAAEAADAFLAEAITEQRTPVRVHVDVLAWTDKPGYDQLGSARNAVTISEIKSGLVSAMASFGAVPHEETVGAPQLWWAGIPGNAGDLPDNECWDTFLEQACCFLQYESNYRDAPGTFGVRLGDRLTGKPVFVDLDITPRQLGWTQNNNMFVLSGSGGGKSFLMNHLCHTFHRLGGHVVIVDVGHSYSNLCRLVDGKYFTYEKERPLAFNPFYIPDGEEPDTEKREAVKSLLMALWKRADESQYRSEYITLSNMIQAYFERVHSGFIAFPCFNSFYEFLRDEYAAIMRRDGVRQKEFDLENFLYVIKPYYAGGEFDFLLNARENLDLLHERFVVFELDRIKSHPILLAVVTLAVTELFLSKTRKLLGVRKKLVIEEAWKAIANEGMADNIREWEKTLRKYMAKIALVSQEIEDIVDSPIIKKTVIGNSDVKILLDQSKFQNRFDEIQSLLGLTDKQKAEVLSINRGHEPVRGSGHSGASGHSGGAGRPYKDLWIGLGPLHSHVYRLEVSPEEYWIYTSEQGEKLRVEENVMEHGDITKAVQKIVSKDAGSSF